MKAILVFGLVFVAAVSALPSLGGSCNNGSGICVDLTKTPCPEARGGFCNGNSNIKCCPAHRPASAPSTPPPSTPAAPTAAPSTAGCGVFAGQTTETVTGNGGKLYQAYRIPRDHLVTPGAYDLTTTQADNRIVTTTGLACAWDKLKSAAAAAGLDFRIASGFRTLQRQEYFWHCYQTKSCNGGNLAAVPGSSNHGAGLAVDINVDCGGQVGSFPPNLCRSSKIYMFLHDHGKQFGFIRTVQKEPWHWEYRPNSASPSWQSFPSRFAEVEETVEETETAAACGKFSGPLTTVTGNGSKKYQAWKIPREYFTGTADNMIVQATACAFEKMRVAALAAKFSIKIASGFRSLERQKYFYDCYKTKKCNGGNLAAVPGTSNHGQGLALDLNTNCGGQVGSHPPAACKSGLYMWLLNNAKKFGFIRTVQKEPWHWEYRPTQAAPSWQKF